MSVLKNKRNLSDLEFYRNAIVLRRNLALLLLRDFNIKDKVRNATAITKKMSVEDAAVFDELTKKYGKLYVLDEYPDWFIDKMRCNILNISHNLVMNIIYANSIYPVYESEFYERRNYQNKAIGNCEQLLQEMQFIISVLPTDVNMYLQYVDLIQKESALLRCWKKSDRKILKAIKKNQTKAEKFSLLNIYIEKIFRYLCLDPIPEDKTLKDEMTDDED